MCLVLRWFVSPVCFDTVLSSSYLLTYGSDIPTCNPSTRTLTLLTYFIVLPGVSLVRPGLMLGLVNCLGTDMSAYTYGQLYGTMILTETYNFSVLQTGKRTSNEPHQTKAQEGKGQSEEFGLQDV